MALRLCRHKANNMNFNIKFRTNEMTKLAEKLKKSLIFGHFGPILPIFGKKKFFLENWAWSAMFYNYLSLCKKSEKNNARLPKKTPN